MYFANDGHRHRFHTVVLELGKSYEGGKVDQEYGAAIYILTADEGFWNDARQHVHRSYINIEAIIDESYLSSGYDVLMRLAGNLFNSQQHVDPVEFGLLDENNFQIALGAIQIRRHMHPLTELTGIGEEE